MAEVCATNLYPNSVGLGRRIPERPEHRIDSGLVARTLRLEPLKNVLIDAQRNQRLRRRRLQPTANNTANNVLYIGFWMLGGRSSDFLGVLQASPISLGFAGSRG